jgi:hypothetical protein
VCPPTGLSFIITATGGDLEPIAGSDDLQQRWEADQPVTFTAPGRWVLHWDVTGTGEGAEDLTVFVSPAPLPGGPTWAPGLTRVAVYVPRLTVDTITPGDGVELGTFTDATTPTAGVARRHVDDAVAEVTAVCGAVPDSLTPLATAVAAQRAAATIQRAYGNTALGLDMLQIAAALDSRADADLARLLTAIRDLADGDADGLLTVYPVWSFDPPDLRFSTPGFF